MAVFTLENESGWALKSGDTFQVSFSLDNSEQAEILLGMIVDGMYNDLIPIQDNTFEMTINAFRDGEYYFTVINISGQEISIASGAISTE